METSVLTLRVSNKTKVMLDKLAKAWQVKEIKAALKEADNQDFNSDKEFAKLVKKYAG